MAAGEILFLKAGSSTSIKLRVESNSCHDAVKALSIIRETNRTSVTCSKDPLTQGAAVAINYSTSPTLETWRVVTITATARDAPDLGTRGVDWDSTSFLMQAILIVAAVFITFMGYRAGDKT